MVVCKGSTPLFLWFPIEVYAVLLVDGNGEVRWK